MADAGDDYLRGVLEEENSGPRKASGEIRWDIERQRDEVRQRFEAHRVGGAGGFLDGVQRAIGSVGGGYRFDEEAIAQKIREFEDLRDRINAKHLDLSQAYAAVSPPSADPPAVAQADATRESITRAIAHNSAMWEYARSFIAALKKASGTYEAHEEDVAETVEDSGGEDDLPPRTGTLFR